MQKPLKKITHCITLMLCLGLSNVTLAKNDQDRFLALATEYEKNLFKFYPEEALFWGLHDIPQDRFADHTIEAIRDWDIVENNTLSSLNQLDVEQIESAAARQSYTLLKNHLEAQRDARICQQVFWNVDPLSGWHNMMVMVAEKQPVGNDKNRANALKRWGSFDSIVDGEIARLERGLSLGYSAPKPAVKRVLTQLQTMITPQSKKSPFYDLAKRDDNNLFKKQVVDLIDHVINPALQRYSDYLQYDYLPLARTKVGVEAIPNGKKCYAALLKQNTTLDITAEEIYAFGLSHMEALKKEIAAIGQHVFGLETIADIFEQGKTHYFFHSEKDMLDYNFAALDRAKAQVPNWFDKIPKAKGTIKPYPKHRAMTGAAGEYAPPSEDGTTPGIFYINTYQPKTRSRIDQEATLFHELIPGHHFQIALSNEDKSHLSIDKYLWNSGYGEGWALYVERLADDMGLYSDEIARLGMLSNEALRTARLVVDPGMHVMGWSRERAVKYMKQHSALDDKLIEGEVDRYIMIPGQATAYMLGKREIEALRQLAQQTLGNDFDIRQFHNQVLKNGAITLPMLRSHIQDWLKNSQGNPES